MKPNEAFIKPKRLTRITFTSTVPRQDVKFYSERTVLLFHAAVAACHLVGNENILMRQYIPNLQLSEHWSAQIIDFTSGYKVFLKIDHHVLTWLNMLFRVEIHLKTRQSLYTSHHKMCWLVGLCIHKHDAVMEMYNFTYTTYILSWLSLSIFVPLTVVIQSYS